MLCPQCQIPVEDGKCPQCGASPAAARRSIKIATRANTTQTSIKFDITGSKPAPSQSDSKDWRSELRQRFEKQPRSQIGFQAERGSSEKVPEEKAVPPSTATAKNPLFQYKLRQSRGGGPPSSRGASERPDTNQQLLGKPLVRQKSVQRGGKSSGGGQKTLDLEPGPLDSDEESVDAGVEREDLLDVSLPGVPEPDESVPLSKEILFSRFLAGMIDLALPASTGFLFTAVASQILGFDLFTVDSLVWAGLVSLAFFFFNSLFFLAACGQTPGMYMTELQLIRDGEDEDAMIPILLRIVLFLPSVVSIAGLLPALFDPLARCVHDILSGTRVGRCHRSRHRLPTRS